MRASPSWMSSDLDEAIKFAVGVVADPLQHARVVAHANTTNADLVVVELAGGEPWAVVAIVTRSGGEVRAMQLSTVVPTNKPEYFTQGSAWWPHETPRWRWILGKRPAGSSEMIEVYRGEDTFAVRPSLSGWFVCMLESDDASGEVHVAVTDRRGFTTALT